MPQSGYVFDAVNMHNVLIQLYVENDSCSRTRRFGAAHVACCMLDVEEYEQALMQHHRRLEAALVGERSLLHLRRLEPAHVGE